MATILNVSAGSLSTAFTADAGSNRVALLFLHAESGVSRLPVTSVLWGAEELVSYVVDSEVNSDTFSGVEHIVLLGPIPESIIAAQNGNTLSITWTGVPAGARATFIFFDDADGSIISAVSKTFTESGVSLDRTLSVPAYGIMVAGITRNYNAGSGIAWPDGTLLADNVSSTTLKYSSAYTIPPGPGATTLTADWSATGSAVAASMIAAVLSPSGSVPATRKMLTLGVG